MELEDLKTSWNALDKRLAETEIVNMRMVKEMVSHKTKSAYDRIVGAEYLQPCGMYLDHLCCIPIRIYEYTHPFHLVRVC